MTIPNPLPKTLPEGTRSRDGQWVSGSVLALEPLPISGLVYAGLWRRTDGKGESPGVVRVENILWPEGDLAAESGTSESKDMSKESDSPEQASVDREERLLEILGGLKGWPLDKRETFAAFNMMGLTSRLQPLQVESGKHQELVVQLAIKLADLTIAEGDRSRSALAQAWEEGKHQGEGEAVGGLGRAENPYKP